MPELRRLLSRLAGGAAALAIFAAVALASRAELGTPPRRSELRLALRAERARLEVCRQRSAEELARLPAHLRALEDCDELAIDYRLTVDIDGEKLLDQVVSHRGVRRTRPLAIEQALAVSPGEHRVGLAFAPILPPELGERALEDTAGKSTREPLREAFRALPAPALRQDLDFQAGRAVLVTLTDDGALRVAR